jgi:hypothetical protein
MSSEQKRQTRLQVDLPVLVEQLDDVRKGERRFEGRLHNLSAGGCAFYHSIELPIGHRVQVKIVLNEDLAKKFKRPELTARGAIVRTEKHGEEYLQSVRFFK